VPRIESDHALIGLPGITSPDSFRVQYPFSTTTCDSE